MIKSSLRGLGCVMAAVLAMASLGQPRLMAQLTSGDLTGTVSDATGAAIPNVSVQAVNVATGFATSQASGPSGDYHFSNLPVGIYNLTANATGFASATVKSISIELNKVATANITLQVGQTTSTVEVTESAVTIDTSTAQISNTYSSKMAQDLPSATVGSGVINLSLLSAGVATSGGVGVGTGPSVGGQRPRNNNFTVEGIDNNSKSVTGPLIFVPNDAVQEFTLLQNQFTAEYGHSSGGQFNTNVLSGTNQFHGMLYEYNQNRNFNATDQLFQNQGVGNPRFDSNRLGAEVGGPIQKNKLFFFANFEYHPIGQVSTTGGVASPTAEGLAQLGQIPGINQTNYQILQKYLPIAPTADQGTDPVVVNGQTYNIPVGTPVISGPNYQNNYYGVASVDYNMSEKDLFRGRFLYNKNDIIDNAAELPTFYTTLPQTFYLATLTEFHNFTPNLTNEFRLGYNRYNQNVPSGNFTFPGLDQFPNLTFDELGLQLGPDPNAPQFTIQNLYQATDNMSWVWGKHTFKFGFDGRKQISPQSFTQRARGDYEYSNIGNYLADLVPDDLAQRTTGDYVYYGDQLSAFTYAEDTYKARPNLTFNLGVRYEFTSVPYGERLQNVNAASSVPGLINFSTPQPQYLNFAPRVGVAYSPGNNGNTSIRAGFGMAYDVLFDNLGILSAPPQFQITVDQTGAPGSGFLANGGIPPSASAGALSPADARAATGGYIPDQKLPYAINWNIGIQHVFARNYTLDVRYVGTHGVHLPVQVQLDRAGIVTPSNSLPTFLTMPSQSTLDSLTNTLDGPGGLQEQYSATATPYVSGGLNPAYYAAGFQNAITSYQPIGSSYYHALDVQLDRRFARGLTFRAAYTWSHNIDNSTAEVFSTVLTPRRPEYYDDLSLEKADSALDHRQRGTLALVYDVPFFSHSTNYFMKNIVGNWEVAPIYTYQTPEYYTVQSGLDSNLNGDTAPDRTVINPAGAANVGSGVTALTNSQGYTVGYLADNPDARYIVAGKGVFPTSGRNTFPGRPIDNIDLTAIKRFSFGERMKLELQAQLLNALNHPQFIAGFLNDVAPIGYTSTAVRNTIIPSSSNFGNFENAFSSNPRTVQFAAKLSF